MSFWEDMSPAVKRYLVIAAVAVVGLLAARSCIGPESSADPPPRGVQR
jgi:hypothetical protein